MIIANVQDTIYILPSRPPRCLGTEEYFGNLIDMPTSRPLKAELGKRKNVCDAKTFVYEEREVDERGRGATTAIVSFATASRCLGSSRKLALRDDLSVVCNLVPSLSL